MQSRMKIVGIEQRPSKQQNLMGLDKGSTYKPVRLGVCCTSSLLHQHYRVCAEQLFAGTSLGITGQGSWVASLLRFFLQPLKCLSDPLLDPL